MVEKEALDSILKKALDFVRKRIDIEAAVLFGSYALGNENEFSDIDLAIFSGDVDSWSTEQKIEFAAELQRDCCPDIELHLYTESALREARPSNFFGHILEEGKKIA